MPALEMEQGTEEWFAARCGRITASRISDILATVKSGEAASRRNYRAELVCERLTDTWQERYTSPEMKWGTEQEPNARFAYEMRLGVVVRKVGFVVHPEYEWTGASPDGLVGEAGMVEIKCPNTATHFATWRGSKIKGAYYAQMQWNLACSGRAWCDFVSYDPRVKTDALQLYVERVQRDDAWIEGAMSQVIAFHRQVDAEITELVVLAKNSRGDTQ